MWPADEVKVAAALGSVAEAIREHTAYLASRDAAEATARDAYDRAHLEIDREKTEEIKAIFRVLREAAEKGMPDLLTLLRSLGAQQGIAAMAHALRRRTEEEQ